MNTILLLLSLNIAFNLGQLLSSLSLLASQNPLFGAERWQFFAFLYQLEKLPFIPLLDPLNI
jgi:hypothetical protein